MYVSGTKTVGSLNVEPCKWTYVLGMHGGNEEKV